MITAQTDSFITSQGLALVVNFADLTVNDSGGTGPLTVTDISSVNIPGMYDYFRARVYAELRSDGTILFTPDPLFEGNAEFSYSVSDGTSTSTGSLYLSVSHSHDAPTFTSSETFDVRENGAKVGPVATVGNAGGPVTYSLAYPDGLDGFTIDPETGAITYQSFNSPGGFDYEAKTSHSLYVVAMNAAGSTVQAVTINVIDAVGQSIRGTSDADRIDRHHGVNGKTASDDGDRINGMRGNDLIKGLRGDDTLIGGSGQDTLAGGQGQDIFIFKTKLGAGNVDRITDFNSGFLPDRIQLDNDVMGGLGGKGLLDSWQFTLSTTGSTSTYDPNVRVIYDTLNRRLFYDADGSGSAEALLIATFGGTPWIMEEMIEIV